MFDDKNKFFSKKMFVLKFYFGIIISVHSTLFRKVKDLDPEFESDPYPYL
jgi:hypothetical protein